MTNEAYRSCKGWQKIRGQVSPEPGLCTEVSDGFLWQNAWPATGIENHRTLKVLKKTKKLPPPGPQPRIP